MLRSFKGNGVGTEKLRAVTRLQYFYCCTMLLQSQTFYPYK